MHGVDFGYFLKIADCIQLRNSGDVFSCNLRSPLLDGLFRLFVGFSQLFVLEI